jgi:hypothetical protein
LGCLEQAKVTQQTVLSLFHHQHPAAVLPVLLLLAVLVTEQLLPMVFVVASWPEKQC